MTLGSAVTMSNASPPDDLITITEGTQKTTLTWAQINYAIRKRFVRSWMRGLKKVRYISLAELLAYEQEMGAFRPTYEEGAPDEGNEEE